MKTWEMIKELTENPKLRFVRTSDSRTFKTSSMKINDAEIIDYYVSGLAKSGSECIALKDDWELVREPVDFMTAVIAHEMGRTIKCDSEGIGTRIYRPGFNNVLVDNSKAPITTHEIINGKWYIE